MKHISYYQRNFKETISLEKNLRNELKRKEQYVEELVQKQAILEQQLQEGLDLLCNFNYFYQPNVPRQFKRA